MMIRCCSILLIPLLALFIAIGLEGFQQQNQPDPSHIILEELGSKIDVISSPIISPTSSSSVTTFLRQQWWFRLLSNLMFPKERDVTQDDVFTLYFERDPKEEINTHRHDDDGNTDDTASPILLDEDRTIQLIRRGDTKQRILKIIGNTTLDTIQGLGFAHGRDRLVQMMLLRSVAMGRLSQDWIDTPATRRIDIQMKTDHQFMQIAQDAFKLLDEETFDRLMAYSQGINHYLATHPTEELPLEFQILGYSPHEHPWTPTCSLISMHIMTTMGLHDVHIMLEKFILQVLHYHKAGDLPSDNNTEDGIDVKLQRIFDPFLDELSKHPNLLKWIKSLEDTGRSFLSEDVLRQNEKHDQVNDDPADDDHTDTSVNIGDGETGLGSNAWVISGQHTQSGKPMLCADPHLDISRVPPIWYQVELVVLNGGRDGNHDDTTSSFLFGITMPGLPVIVMGQRNQDLSVAFTYGFGDYYDFWIEEIRNGQYRSDEQGKFLDVKVRTATIQPKKQQKGNNNVTVVTFWTEHGKIDLKNDPVLPITPLEDQESLAQQLLQNGFYLSKSSITEGRHIANGLSAIWKITERSQSVMEAADFCSQVFLSANFVIADGQGNIGYQQSGIHPRRSPDSSGILPLPAWESKYQWQGVVEPHDLVRVINPPSGFIASANNDAMDMLHEDQEKEDIPRTLNVHMGPYRRDRILELLLRTESSNTISKYTMEDMEAMQADTSVPGTTREWIMERARPTIQRHSNTSSSAKLLLEWDGRNDADSGGAVVYDAIYQGIMDQVFGDGVFGTEVWRFIKTETALFNLFQSTFDRQVFDRKDIKDRKSIDTTTLNSFVNELEWLDGIVSQAFANLDGTTIATTTAPTWGEMHKFYLHNVLFQDKDPFAHLLGYSVGPFPFAGGAGVVWQGSSRQVHGITKVVGPSWRYLCDLGNDTVATALPGGPSGDKWDGALYSSGMEDIVDRPYDYFSLP